MHDAVAHHPTGWCAASPWAAVSASWPTLPVYIQIMTSRAMKYYFGQFELTVLTASLRIIVFLQPSLMQSMRNWRILHLVWTVLSSNERCQHINVILILNPNHNTILATRKKTNSFQLSMSYLNVQRPEMSIPDLIPNFRTVNLITYIFSDISYHVSSFSWICYWRYGGSRLEKKMATLGGPHQRAGKKEFGVCSL